MEEKIWQKAIREFNWIKVLAALALIAMGVFSILWPSDAIQYTCWLIGGCLGLYGVYLIFTFIIAKDSSLAFQLVLGILSIGLGIFVIFGYTLILDVVRLAVAVIIIVFGLLGLRRAFIMRSMAFKDWWVSLILALATVAVGAVLIVNAALFRDLVPMITGGVLIYIGVTDLINMIRLISVAKYRRKRLGVGTIESEPPHEEL